MNDALPVAVWSGSFMLGNIEMRCHVLDTGVRVIEQECVDQLFSDGANFTAADADEFARWMRSPDAGAAPKASPLGNSGNSKSILKDIRE